MKSFKQYLKDKSEPEQGAMVNGVPSVVILHGSHNMIHEAEGKQDDWLSKNDNTHLTTSKSQSGQIMEIGTKLHQDQGDERYNSTNELHHALKKYSDESNTLNTGLLKHHYLQKPITGKVGGHNVGILDKATTKNKLKTNLHVYSGVSFHPGDIAAKNPEGHVHLPAFTSASIDKGVAKQFAQSQYHGDDEDNIHHHVIHFHLNEGQPGAYIGESPHGGIHQHSFNPQEHEFVLPRNTTVKINPKPETFSEGNRHLHVWHAHPV